MLLAEYRDGLLRQAIQATVEARRLPIGRRSTSDYQSVHQRDKPKPFTWTADPDKITAAVKHGHQVLSSIHRDEPRSCRGYLHCALVVVGELVEFEGAITSEA